LERVQKPAEAKGPTADDSSDESDRDGKGPWKPVETRKSGRVPPPTSRTSSRQSIGSRNRFNLLEVDEDQNHDSSSLGAQHPEPLHKKGKGIDPGNFGGIGLPESDLNIDAQHAALRQWNEAARRSRREDSTGHRGDSLVPQELERKTLEVRVPAAPQLLPGSRKPARLTTLALRMSLTTKWQH
jgi:hypothetical protein